jgi:FkbM family methyltransferase
MKEKEQMSLFDAPEEKEGGLELSYLHIQGGNVPGGHNCLYDGVRKPFITPVRETNSIPLRHSDIVVDIGAYVGTYAIRCARFPVKRVIAYEPTPFTFSVLSQTKLLNLDARNAAVVGDNRKEVTLSISKGIGVTNTIVCGKVKRPKQVIVSAVNYEDAVRGASIVKIDVEGAEYDFPIVQPGVRSLIIDFHKRTEFDWVERAYSMISLIEASGFKPVITPDFSNGWTQAGSWIRDTEDQGGGCEELLSGRYCCGCSTPVAGEGKKALCADCWALWSKKHREGFVMAEVAP